MAPPRSMALGTKYPPRARNPAPASRSAPNKRGILLIDWSAFSFAATSMGDPTEIVNPRPFPAGCIALIAATAASRRTCSHRIGLATRFGRLSRATSSRPERSLSTAMKPCRFVRSCRCWSRSLCSSQRGERAPGQEIPSISASMADRTFLARIDIGRFAGLEEERRHVLGKERPCLRIHHVEPVMIDQHCLLLEPIGPALRAEFFYDAGADGAGKRSLNESCARLSTAHTGYSLRH